MWLKCCDSEAELNELDELLVDARPDIDYTGKCPYCGTELWVEDTSWGDNKDILIAHSKE